MFKGGGMKVLILKEETKENLREGGEGRRTFLLSCVQKLREHVSGPTLAALPCRPCVMYPDVGVMSDLVSKSPNVNFYFCRHYG